MRKNMIDQLCSMNMNKKAGHVSPHKAVMMLAVIDLVAAGGAKQNRFVYGPELLEHFRRYFDVVKTPVDSFSPLLPFFFLRSEPFWHHQPVPGQEAVCAAISEPGGARKLQSIVEYAFLDDALFARLQDAAGREEAREALICKYSPSHHDELMRLAAQEEGAGLYAQVLRGERKASGRVKEDVRDLAFARVVKQAYHFQCAACGLRIVFDGASLVDAAHIIPFAESHDDDPCNGLSLCKNHHWAMDQELIFPCSDNCWHVHKGIDDRIDGQRALIDLHQRPLIAPVELRFSPKPSALTWREQRLKVAR